MELYNEKGEKLIFSHGTLLTEKEDAAACDMVDALIQGTN